MAVSLGPETQMEDHSGREDNVKVDLRIDEEELETSILLRRREVSNVICIVS